ncbi:MAG: hypothetical protein M1828_004377 [Chrysothrix sp. TS-e1954]|nr:MAG: hypothetical protein M1828_004377 [Chrysothrix sp. TS-e1954]
MAPTYKIAVVQLYPKPMQPEKNFEKAASFIRSAATQRCDLVVLPEYHLTNWLPKDPKFRDLCADWSEYLEKYRTLARECNINIVPGTIVQTRTSNHPDENDLENVAYFISNLGEILGKYVKKNLWSTERVHLLSSGREDHVAFDTPLGKVGMLICWDLAFPEAFRELISQDAKLIIMPTFWTHSDCSDAGLAHNPSAEVAFVDSAITTRAFENTCGIVFANAGGPPGRGYMGLSQVSVPFVGPLTRLGSSAEGMGIVDLDMKILEDAEANYQIRSDLASDVWHYDYRHSKGSRL